MTSIRKTPPISLRSSLALLVLLTIPISGGCQTDNPGPVARSLPAPPGRLMHPVAVPVLSKGQDARAALRLTSTALIEANARLSAAAGWYESVRKTYSAGRER